MDILTTDQGTTNATSPTGVEGFLFQDYTQRIIIATILCIVVLLGIVGNSLVILAIMLSKKLRSPTNWFILNLACADLFTCFSIPFNIVAMLSKDGWPIPEWICAVNSAISLTCLGASVMSLALIAYSRWYLLTQPLVKFQKLFTRKTISLMVAVSWIYPFLLVIIPHFLGLGRLGYSYKYKSCTQDTSIQTSEFYSLIAGAGVIIPVFFAIVIIYIRIYRHVMKHNKNMSMSTKKEVHEKGKGLSIEMSSSEISFPGPSNLQTDTSQTDLSTSSSQNVDLAGRNISKNDEYTDKSSATGKITTDPSLQQRSHFSTESTSESPATYNMTGPTLHHNDRNGPKDTQQKTTAPSRMSRRDISVTKRLFMIVLAFFVCLLPFGVSVVVPPSDPGIPWTGMLLSFNSCINFFIYARTMPLFREVMWHIARCQCRKIPEPVGCLRR